MTACQIRSKVKTHCSCMGCETLNSSCTLWKPHLMQRTQPALPSTTLETDTGHRLRTGKLHQPRQQSAPFLKGREGRMHILQLANADDALGPWGILKTQQHPLWDWFIQSGMCFLWGKRASRTGLTSAVAEHARLVGCGSAPRKRNFIRKTPRLDREIVSNWEFTATSGKLFHTVQKPWYLHS